MEISNKLPGDYISYIRNMVGHNKIILSAACCIIRNENGEVLLQQRDSGLWGLPGGIMELGESLEETAVREVFEETGLKIMVGSLFGVYSKYFAQYRNGDVSQPIVTVFYADIIGGEMKCDGVETLDLKYFSKDSLPEIFCEQHIDILSDHFSGKTGSFR